MTTLSSRKVPQKPLLIAAAQLPFARTSYTLALLIPLYCPVTRLFSPPCPLLPSFRLQSSSDALKIYFYKKNFRSAAVETWRLSRVCVWVPGCVCVCVGACLWLSSTPSGVNFLYTFTFYAQSDFSCCCFFFHFAVASSSSSSCYSFSSPSHLCFFLFFVDVSAQPYKKCK